MIYIGYDEKTNNSERNSPMHIVALMLIMFSAYLFFQLTQKKEDLKKKDIEIKFLREELGRYREEQLSMYSAAYKNFLSSNNL